MLFLFRPESVVIAMDSLVSSPDGPHMFTTKVFPMPHLQAAICGTGSRDLVLDWHTRVQRDVLARSVLVLDRLAPKVLPEIEAELMKVERFTESTVYQFGWSPEENQFIGFAYRSTNGYASERLDYGFGLKPQIPIPDDLDLQDLASMPVLMQMQREADEARPPRDRVGIGGEIHVLAMSPSRQIMWTHHRFVDADEMFEEMLNNDGIRRV